VSHLLGGDVASVCVNACIVGIGTPTEKFREQRHMASAAPHFLMQITGTA
jgi:hypothetical protein